MTNFDKLLEDPENREVIIAAVSRKFYINKNNLYFPNIFIVTYADFTVKTEIVIMSYLTGYRKNMSKGVKNEEISNYFLSRRERGPKIL